MSVLFRRLFRTTIFSRSSKVAIATSNFMSKLYNGGLLAEFSVSVLKEIIRLVRHYLSETRIQNLLKMEVLNKSLNKTDMEKVG